ncbi:MAG: hypothetical protein UU23_C0002G0023 [Candidatus Curtissbacteria bacterium GW2011_GWA1_40_9]|uniref:Uncharacterized protein n=1 Tax=Candidatus Curtissbacteria bacterium GW2011_GWA1_40_9 TaxID=1618408 RepID=A0A0G0TTQ8_9BACT|nr:MAG: hypothetical protein UU23_C0002G0023 [Candidatus Curtissbacteria bacterium GW2011_GWA1_40_9]
MTLERVVEFIEGDIVNLPKDHPDRSILDAHLTLMSTQLAERKKQAGGEIALGFERQEGESRSAYLRRKYQKLNSETHDIPLERFTDQTIGAKGAPIRTVYKFLSWYLYTGMPMHEHEKAYAFSKSNNRHNYSKGAVHHKHVGLN